MTHDGPDLTRLRARMEAALEGPGGLGLGATPAEVLALLDRLEAAEARAGWVDLLAWDLAEELRGEEGPMLHGSAAVDAYDAWVEATATPAAPDPARATTAEDNAT